MQVQIATTDKWYTQDSVDKPNFKVIPKAAYFTSRLSPITLSDIKPIKTISDTIASLTISISSLTGFTKDQMANISIVRDATSDIVYFVTDSIILNDKVDLQLVRDLWYSFFDQIVFNTNSMFVKRGHIASNNYWTQTSSNKIIQDDIINLKPKRLMTYLIEGATDTLTEQMIIDGVNSIRWQYLLYDVGAGSNFEWKKNSIRGVEPYSLILGATPSYDKLNNRELWVMGESDTDELYLADLSEINAITSDPKSIALFSSPVCPFLINKVIVKDGNKIVIVVNESQADSTSIIESDIPVGIGNAPRVLAINFDDHKLANKYLIDLAIPNWELMTNEEKIKWADDITSIKIMFNSTWSYEIPKNILLKYVGGLIEFQLIQDINQNTGSMRISFPIDTENRISQLLPSIERTLSTDAYKSYMNANQSQLNAGLRESTFKPLVGSILGGATSGAIVGSVIPGLGTAIGAGVGALTGALKGVGGSITGHHFEKNQQQALTEDLKNIPDRVDPGAILSGVKVVESEISYDIRKPKNIDQILVEYQKDGNFIEAYIDIPINFVTRPKWNYLSVRSILENIIEIQAQFDIKNYFETLFSRGVRLWNDPNVWKDYSSNI